MNGLRKLVVFTGLILFIFYKDTFSADCRIVDSNKKYAYEYYLKSKELLKINNYKDALNNIYQAASFVFPDKDYIDVKLRCTTLKPGPYAPIIDEFEDYEKREYKLKELMEEILKHQPTYVYIYNNNSYINPYIKICNSNKSKIALKYLTFYYNDSFSSQNISLSPGECKIIKSSVLRTATVIENISRIKLLDIKVKNFYSYYSKIMEELR